MSFELPSLLGDSFTRAILCATFSAASDAVSAIEASRGRAEQNERPFGRAGRRVLNRQSENLAVAADDLADESAFAAGGECPHDHFGGVVFDLKRSRQRLHGVDQFFHMARFGIGKRKGTSLAERNIRRE